MVKITQREIIEDPFQVKNVIFALSEPIRVQILKYLYNTTDADAKTIAQAISKATNTTLYHLNILNEAGIVECKHKPKGGKPVYHWSLKEREFDLNKDDVVENFSESFKIIKEEIIKKIDKETKDVPAHFHEHLILVLKKI